MTALKTGTFMQSTLHNPCGSHEGSKASSLMTRLLRLRLRSWPLGFGKAPREMSQVFVVLMRGVWGAQAASRYGVSRQNICYYPVHYCHYHYHDDITSPFHVVNGQAWSAPVRSHTPLMRCWRMVALHLSATVYCSKS